MMADTGGKDRLMTAKSVEQKDEAEERAAPI